MRKYFIYYGDFSNAYDLIYTENSEQEALAKEKGYERITRKEAEKKCVMERDRRKSDPSFAYYAPAYIHPLVEDATMADFENYPYIKGKYTIEKM